MSSDNKIYSINPKKKEIVIEKGENNEISELIKNVNKLSKKYDFFNREFSCDDNNFKDKIKDIIENISELSKGIDREIIQKGNIKSEKNMFVEYI
jgi:hypothetical protein